MFNVIHLNMFNFTNKVVMFSYCSCQLSNCAGVFRIVKILTQLSFLKRERLTFRAWWMVFSLKPENVSNHSCFYYIELLSI